MKHCNNCKQTKPFESFYKNSNNNDGLYYICVECHRNHARKYERSAKGKETTAKKGKKMYEAYKKKHLSRAKTRYAVKKGVLIKPSVCSNCSRRLPLQAHHEDYAKPLEVQ